MAEAKKPIPIKLPPETIKRLEAASGDLKNLKEAMAALKEIGLDVSQFEEKLLWTEKAREVLLNRFK